jgi:pimeloyl-ACP methyl ester carboxylesterase
MSLSTSRSEQYGHERLDFGVPGSPGGFIIQPAQPAKGAPWLWYAPSFIKQPYPLPKALHAWLLTRLLDAGIAVAGVDAGEAWGSPAGRAIFSAFYKLVVPEFHLATKACLLAQSRGGLFHYNWAVENPACVRCIGAIYPVCEVTLRARKEEVTRAYGLTTDQILQQLPRHNPVDRLAPLAAARVPLFHIHGEVDAAVPIETNSAELVKRYRQLGGPAELVIIRGKGHEEVPEFFQCSALLEFFLSQA